jgi:hypothetical protein
MTIANYDAAAGGPSSAALVDTTMAQNQLQSGMDRSQMGASVKRLNNAYTDVQQPALESSLSGSGHYYGTQARMDEAQQHIGLDNQVQDLHMAFARTQSEMTRQQAFAGLGMIIG